MVSDIKNSVRPVGFIVVICSIVERFLTYARYAVRNYYACKATAIPERTNTYARYAVRYCYARKATATTERTITYARYAVSDCYTCKALAIGERIIAYTRYAVRNRYACKARATVERHRTYPRHLIPVGRYSRYHDVGICTAADAADIASAVSIACKLQPFAGFCLRGKYKSVLARGGA